MPDDYLFQFLYAFYVMLKPLALGVYYTCRSFDDQIYYLQLPQNRYFQIPYCLVEWHYDLSHELAN